MDERTQRRPGGRRCTSTACPGTTARSGTVDAYWVVRFYCCHSPLWQIPSNTRHGCGNSSLSAYFPKRTRKRPLLAAMRKSATANVGQITVTWNLEWDEEVDVVCTDAGVAGLAGAISAID